MQINNINSTNFNGIIAKTSTMTDIEKETISAFEQYTNVHPDISELIQEMNIDVAFANTKDNFNDVLSISVLDRNSKRRFSQRAVTHLSNFDLKHQLKFFDKISEFLRDISANKITRPVCDKKYLVSPNVEYSLLDTQLHNDLLRNRYEKDKLSGAQKIYTDFFKKVDNDFIYET